MKKRKVRVESVINRIKKDLDDAGFDSEESVFLERNRREKNNLIIENEIEKGLITAKNYSNPTTFLPMNPLTRVIKKMILSLIRVYTKSQIVFNQNILYSANKLYQYFLHSFQSLKNESVKNSRKISDLEKRIKILEKRLKNDA